MFNISTIYLYIEICMNHLLPTYLRQNGGRVIFPCLKDAYFLSILVSLMIHDPFKVSLSKFSNIQNWEDSCRLPGYLDLQLEIITWTIREIFLSGLHADGSWNIQTSLLFFLLLVGIPGRKKWGIAAVGVERNDKHGIS